MEPNFKNDLILYIDGIKVGKLQGVSYGISVDVFPEENTGENGIIWRRGKRVVTGSFTFKQPDRHPVLQAIFDVTKTLENWPFPVGGKLPPFDATITGVTEGGDAVELKFFGIEVTRELLDTSVEYKTVEFKALEVVPWRVIDLKYN